jgi:hypothetical protein
MVIDMGEEAVRVRDAFLRDLNDLSGTYRLCLTGVKFWTSEAVEDMLSKAPSPDTRLWMTQDPPAGPAGIFYASWTAGETPARLALDGPVIRQVGQMWAVMVYALWEHQYRPALATALGIAIDDVKVDALGDLRHMRNDIVHCNGIATPANTGRCKLFRWFPSGDAIHIMPSHVDPFYHHLHLKGQYGPWGPLGISGPDHPLSGGSLGGG